jgi:predicted SAM-dependent methyltransferase
MKVNIGCCDDGKLEGYINLDLNKDIPGVFPANALYLPFKNNSIEEIYASHFLEHLEGHHIHLCLQEWHRVLIPNGLVRVIVPDMEVLCKEWLVSDINRKANWLCPAIFGSHRGPGQDHKCGLDAPLLWTLLLTNGFKVIKCRHNEQWNFWLEVDAVK